MERRIAGSRHRNGTTSTRPDAGDLIEFHPTPFRCSSRSRSIRGQRHVATGVRRCRHPRICPCRAARRPHREARLWERRSHRCRRPRLAFWLAAGLLQNLGLAQNMMCAGSPPIRAEALVGRVLDAEQIRKCAQPDSTAAIAVTGSEAFEPVMGRRIASRSPMAPRAPAHHGCGGSGSIARHGDTVALRPAEPSISVLARPRLPLRLALLEHILERWPLDQAAPLYAGPPTAGGILPDAAFPTRPRHSSPGDRFDRPGVKLTGLTRNLGNTSKAA